MSEVWTSEQIRISLGSIIRRINVNKDAFKIKIEGKEVRYTDYSRDNHIYLVLEENTDRIYFSIGTHSGSFTPTKKTWFWQQDPEYNAILEYIRDLKAIASSGGETAAQAVMKAFPEAVDVEFEDKFLKK